MPTLFFESSFDDDKDKELLNDDDNDVDELPIVMRLSSSMLSLSVNVLDSLDVESPIDSTTLSSSMASLLHLRFLLVALVAFWPKLLQ